MELSPVPTLHHAAERGDLLALARLVADGADPNAPDADAQTPLTLAAKNGHLEPVQALLKWGANPNAPGPRGITPLVYAVQGGHAEIARLLLARGAQTQIYIAPEPHVPPSPEEQRKFLRLMKLMQEAESDRDAGDTPAGPFDDIDFSLADEEIAALQAEAPKPRRVNLLQKAIRSGDWKTLRVLLEAGLDPNEQIPIFGDEDATTRPAAVDYVVMFDRPEMLPLLLEFGADPNGRDISSPLMSATMKGNLPLAQMLLEAGADPNRGLAGMPPLAFAIHNGRPDLVALLVKHGASTTGEGGTLGELLSVRDPDMRAALNLSRGADWHALVTEGDLSGVRTVLDGGADVNACGDVENTALMLAAKAGNGPLVSLLLERGADVGAKNRQGAAALHFAAAGEADDSPDIVRALLARGASPDESEQGGATPLLITGIRRTPGVADALRDAGATVGLVEAALLGDAGAVRGFVEAGVPVDARSSHQMTALMAASAHGDTDLCRWLLDQGADPNLRQNDGETALHWAARRGHAGTCAILLDWGADINATEGKSDKTTPLLGAAQNGHVDVVQMLLARGASVAEPPEQATGPVDGLIHALLWNEADYHKRPEPLILPLLLGAGADPNARNGDAMTPLAVVWKQGWPEPFADLFLSHGANVNFTVRGKTWLLRAVEADDDALARRLLDLGADPNRGNRWFNPLDVAVVRGNEALAALLREHVGVLSTRPQEAGVTDDERAQLLDLFAPHESLFDRLSREAATPSA